MPVHAALTSGFQRALLACSIAMLVAAVLAIRATNTRGEPSALPTLETGSRKRVRQSSPWRRQVDPFDRWRKRAGRAKITAMLMSPPDRELAEIGVRLIDGAYMAWLVAERECDEAMRAWQEERPGAYWGYRAALDREEAAARDLQRLSELASPCGDVLEEPSDVRQPAPAVGLAGDQRLPRRSTQP